MNKKLLTIFITILLLPINVCALSNGESVKYDSSSLNLTSNGYVWTAYCNLSDGCTASNGTEVSNGSWYSYNYKSYDYNFKDSSNNVFSTYCVEPQKSSGTTTTYTVTYLGSKETDAGYLSILTSGKGHDVIETALRIYSLYAGDASTGNYARNYMIREMENLAATLTSSLKSNANVSKLPNFSKYSTDYTAYRKSVTNLNNTFKTTLIDVLNTAISAIGTTNSSLDISTESVTVDKTIGKASGTFKVKSTTAQTVEFSFDDIDGLTITSSGCNWDDNKCSHTFTANETYEIQVSLTDVCKLTDGKLNLNYDDSSSSKTAAWVKDSVAEHQKYITLVDDGTTGTNSKSMQFDSDDICGGSSSYCVKNGTDYYKCNTTTYDSSCTKYDNATKAKEDIDNNVTIDASCNLGSTSSDYCVYYNDNFYVCPTGTYTTACELETETVAKSKTLTDSCKNANEEKPCTNTVVNGGITCSNATSSGLLTNTCNSSADSDYKLEETVNNTDWTNTVCLKDTAGNKLKNNSVKLKDGSTSSNSYCGVYCTEGFDITMPSIRPAVAGRWINIDMSINKASETCYLITDTEKFNNQYTVTKAEIDKELRTYATVSNEATINAYIVAHTSDTVTADEAREDYLDNTVKPLYEKIQRLNTVLNKYVGDYQNCSDFTYEYSEIDKTTNELYAEIEYYYSEPYEKDGSTTDKWITDAEAIGAATMIRDKDTALTVTYSDTSYYTKDKNATTNATKTVDAYTCTTGSDVLSLNCQNTTATIPDYAIVEKTASINDVKYITPRVYYNVYASGNVKVLSSAPSEKYTVINGLPIGYETPDGTYNYSLTFGNIGTFYESGEHGRFYGSNDSVSNQVKEYLENNCPDIDSSSKNVTADKYACTYDVTSNAKDGYCKYDTSENQYYVCSKDVTDYTSNALCNKASKSEALSVKNLGTCDDDGDTYCYQNGNQYYICTAKADATNYGSVCTEATKEVAGCAKHVEDCDVTAHICKITNSGGTITNNNNDEEETKDYKVSFKTIATHEVFPSADSKNITVTGSDSVSESVYNFNREIGYNWSWDPSVSNSLLASKAYNTIVEIQARAEDTSTETDGSAAANEDAKTKLTVTLDSGLIRHIKNYNKTNDSYDSSDTLKCYDYVNKALNSEYLCNNESSSNYVWEDNKCKIKNMFCYSTFIDDLITNFSSNIDAGSRPTTKSDIESTEFTDIDKLPYSSLTPSTEASYKIGVTDYWTIYKTATLDVNGDGFADAGPSWK